jgi:hypothetical protein
MVPTAALSPQGAVAADGPDDDDDDDDGEDARESSPPPRPLKAPPARAQAITPKDVVKLARTRLREVEKDLKRLRRLEVERDELRRLLDAAKTKPRGVVREIKRSAG